MNKEPPTHLQALWQNQPAPPRKLSPEEIRGKAVRFQRTIRFRNLREYVAAVLVLIVFSGYAWKAGTWLSKAGPILIVLGTLYVVFQLASRGASAPVPGDEAAGLAETCGDFHRRELSRQRDLLGSVWRWYLGPLVPGLVVMFVDGVLASWPKGGAAVMGSFGSALAAALVFAFVGWLNRTGARKLQREIDALGPIDQQGDKQDV